MTVKDLRVARDDVGSSGCGEVGLWELVVVDGHGGGEDSLSVGGESLPDPNWATFVRKCTPIQAK
jgi:hypothetical protein